jgi:hypothetical protein
MNRSRFVQASDTLALVALGRLLVSPRWRPACVAADLEGCVEQACKLSPGNQYVVKRSIASTVGKLRGALL